MAHLKNTKYLLYFLLLEVVAPGCLQAFVSVPAAGRIPASEKAAATVLLAPSFLAARNSNKDEDDGSDRPISNQRKQELVFEEMSRIGAEKIAQLSIAERTKRAMLAEAVEDQIFDNTEQLEKMVINGNGTIPEKLRQQAAEIATQTKALQVQYQELVSGQPSSVLNSLEAAMGKTSSDDDKDYEQYDKNNYE